MTKIVVAIVVALAALLGPVAPASADTERPTVRWSLHDHDNRGAVRVQLQAPRRAWGIRPKAREYDRQIAGLRIDRRGRCRAHPQMACIKVHVVRFDRRGWPTRQIGRARIDGPYDRTIWLNAMYHRNHEATVAHELAHALGLDHHDRWGAVGGVVVKAKHLSRPEKRALRRNY